MKYKVGDKVRVRRDLEEYGQYGKYGANRNMAELHGSIVEIKKVENEKQRYEINDNLYYWTDEMFEGLVEDELTAEEATKILGEICCENELCGGCPIGEAKGKMTCQNFQRDKTEEVLEILKQWKKDHEKKDVETEFTWCVLIIEADTHILKHEEKVETYIKSVDAKKAEILKKYCSEHDGKYYAISERRCVVKEWQ
jgi:hypothetical protein